jgi:hypothetical protein
MQSKFTGRIIVLTESNKSPLTFYMCLVFPTVLTQLSVLKVKLADKYESGTRSKAATAPASLLFNIASDAHDEGKSEIE